MDKLLIYEPEDKHGRHFFRSDEISSGVKLADDYDWSPETKGIIANIKPDPRKVVVLLNAMGAGEYYGPNSRGDYFRETELLDNYHTFERIAHVFKFHQNKDPKKSYGKVLHSIYNPRMHRVELVISVNRDKAPDIAEKIDNGEFPSVSMGAKVQADKCSICGKLNKVIAEYCSHLKDHMGEILDDGRQVYADNIKPKFFDISFVPVGADRTARVLAKVASGAVVPSAMLAEAYYGSTKEAESLGHKFSWENLVSREKNIPVPKNLPKESAWQILSTYVKFGVMPSMKEFAGYMKSAGIDPSEDMDADFYSEVEFPKISSIIPFRSAKSPYLENRVIDSSVLKYGSDDNIEIRLVSHDTTIKIARDPDSQWLGVNEAPKESEKISANEAAYYKLYSKFADGAMDYLSDKVDDIGMSYVQYRVSPMLEKTAMHPSDQVGMERFFKQAGEKVIFSDVTNQSVKKELLCRIGILI